MSDKEVSLLSLLVKICYVVFVASMLVLGSRCVYDLIVLENSTESTASSCSDVSSTSETPSEVETSVSEIIYVEEVVETPEWKKNLPCTEEFKSHVKSVAEYYGFTEELVYQIIQTESRFDVNAYNGADHGLMQINYKNLDYYATKVDDDYSSYFTAGYDVYDPEINVILGCRVLSDWKRMTGCTDLTDLLSYYNRGWKYKSDHITAYADKVLSVDLNSLDFSSMEVIR